MATRVTALILTLGFSLSVRAEEVPQYEWKKITMTDEFAPRDGAGAIPYKGKMWLESDRQILEVLSSHLQ